LVYQVGVIEHFLDHEEKIAYMKKMYSVTKNGGFIVNLVPSGIYPLREKMKKQGLGAILSLKLTIRPKNLRLKWLNVVRIVSSIYIHIIFSDMFLIEKKPSFVKMIRYYILQIIPFNWIPYSFAGKYGFRVMGISQKA